MNGDSTCSSPGRPDCQTKRSGACATMSVRAGGARRAALLRAVDELHRDAAISDETWSRLSASYDEQQLIELCMLIGHYHMVAFTLNSLRVQREEGVPGLGEP